MLNKNNQSHSKDTQTILLETCWLFDLWNRRTSQGGGGDGGGGGTFV